MTYQPSRHVLSLGSGDVLAVDSGADVPSEVLERMRVAAAELYELSIEHRVGLLQIGPEMNVWPDRQQPGTTRR